MNVNVLKGIDYLKRKKGSGAWEKAKRAEKIRTENQIFCYLCMKQNLINLIGQA